MKAAAVVIATTSSTKKSPLTPSNPRENHIPVHKKKKLPSWNPFVCRMPQMLTPLPLVSSSAPIVNHSAKHSSRVICTPIPSAKAYPPFNNPFLLLKGAKPLYHLGNVLAVRAAKVTLQVSQI